MSSMSTSPRRAWIPPVARETFMSEVPTDQLGLKVLYKGNQIDIDIIAVHGLGAIPDITWKEKTSQVNWLQDKDMLPSKIPNSRIMRFGYDSLWFCRNPVRTSAETISKAFCRDLEEQRQDCGDRALIFIGHCFGGLVIQKAVVLDYLDNGPSRTILSKTAGIIFLGTPHSGSVTFTANGVSHPAIISLLAATSDLRLEAGVLKDLESPYSSLSDISKDFLRLSSRFQELRVVNFFEQRISKVGKLLGRADLQEFVVNEASATLGSYPTFGLPLDHYSLNKFPSANDWNFHFVCREIGKIYNHIPKKATEISQRLLMQSSSIQSRHHHANEDPSTDSTAQLPPREHIVKKLVIGTRLDIPSKKLHRAVTLALTLSPILGPDALEGTQTVVWKVLSFSEKNQRRIQLVWSNRTGFCLFDMKDDEKVRPNKPSIEVLPNDSVTLQVEDDMEDDEDNDSEQHFIFSTSSEETDVPGDIAIVSRTDPPGIALFIIDITRPETDQACPVLTIPLEKDVKFSCSVPVLLQAYPTSQFKERQVVSRTSAKPLFSKPINIMTLGETTTFHLYSNNNNKIFLE